MRRVGALTESAPRRDVAPARGRAIELARIDAAPDTPIPWLLTLLPLGALAMAGLLVLVLGFVTMAAVPPRIESTLGEAHTLGMPSADGREGHAPVLRVGPEPPR